MGPWGRKVLLAAIVISAAFALIGFDQATPGLAFHPMMGNPDNLLKDEGSIHVLVKYKSDAGFRIEDLVVRPSPEQLRRRSKDGFLNSVSNDVARKKARVVREFQSTPYVAMEVTSEGFQSLLQNPDVASVTEDRVFSISLADSLPYINASASWGLGFTGAGQVVCVIDTGIDYRHPSLGNCSGSSFLSGACDKIPSGFDFVNNDNDPFDDHGHGTHVAGIIAAQPFEFCDASCRNFTGVAPDAKIIAIKACDQSGRCSESNILAGIEWCTANAAAFNISVISMSLGGGQYDSEEVCVNDYLAMHEVVNAAAKKDIFVLGASGNRDGSEEVSAGILSPACLPNVTSVGSINLDDTLSSFSYRGRLLDFLAPGNGIRSTAINGGNTRMSGTSMATPHVAGAVILLRGAKSQLGRKAGNEEIKNIFRETGRAIQDIVSGLTFARIDIGQAMARAVGKKMNSTIVLQNGWNAFSIPIDLGKGSISGIFSSLGEDYALLHYNRSDASWRAFKGQGQESDTLQGIDSTMGLFIYLPSSKNFSFEGIVPLNATLKLEKGWNLIGWPLAEMQNISELPWIGNVSKIVSPPKDGAWQSYEPGRDASLNTLEYFNATRAYWVKSRMSMEVGIGD